MKKFAVKLNISNSVNSDESDEWMFFETIEERYTWIEEKKKEEEKWLKTSGVRSMRYYYFSEYNVDDLLKKQMNELNGLTLGDLINIIKNT